MANYNETSGRTALWHVTANKTELPKERDWIAESLCILLWLVVILAVSGILYLLWA